MCCCVTSNIKKTWRKCQKIKFFSNNFALKRFNWDSTKFLGPLCHTYIVIYILQGWKQKSSKRSMTCNLLLVPWHLPLISIFFFLFKTHRLFQTIIKNGILLPKLSWPTVRKIVLVIEKSFWNSRLKAWEFAKILEITRTIYSNSERSEQFLVTGWFFLTCSWRFLISKKLEQLEFKLEKKYWDLETCRKS